MAAWEKSCAVLPAGCWEVFPAVVVMPAVVGGAVVTVVAAALVGCWVGEGVVGL